MFIVSATIVDMVGDSPWYYLACKCNRSVTLMSNVYFCDNCRVPILQVCPRWVFMVKC